MIRRSRSASRQSGSPRLTPKIVSDECALAAAIDDLLRDPIYEQITRKIVRAQDALQAAASKEAFSSYLDLEAHVNWRFTCALASVAAWAFKQGQRRRRRARRG